MPPAVKATKMAKSQPVLSAIDRRAVLERPAKANAPVKMILAKRAEELLRQINGAIARIDTKMARMSAPEGLKKLEQDQASLRLRAITLLKALESGTHDAFHHLDGNGDCHLHDLHGEHHGLGEIESLHLLASDVKRAAYEHDHHENISAAMQLHGTMAPHPFLASTVALCGFRDMAHSVLHHAQCGASRMA